MSVESRVDGQRRRCEQQLLSYAAEVGSTNFLSRESIGPEYFQSLYNEARAMFEKCEAYGHLPTASRLEEEFIGVRLSEVPDERDVEDLKRELRETHARDLVVKRMGEAKNYWSGGDWMKIPQEMANWASEINRILSPQVVTDLVGEGMYRYDDFRQAAIDREEETQATSFAHPGLNDFLGGYQPGDLVSYVARSGVGKTFATILDAYHIWAQGVPILFVSLEMSATQVGYRFDSLASQNGDVSSAPGFSIFNLRKGIAVKDSGNSPAEKAALATEDSTKAYRDHILDLENARKRGEKPPFYVVTPQNAGARITPRYIQSLAAELGVGMVFVDYMELVDADSGQTDKRLRLGEVSRAFKLAAGALGIPFVVPHQMNRETEKVAEVTISNLADSDDVARHMDMVIYLTKEGGLVRYKVLKMRSGPTDKKFAWYWDYDSGVRTVQPYELYEAGDGEAVEYAEQTFDPDSWGPPGEETHIDEGISDDSISDEPTGIDWGNPFG